MHTLTPVENSTVCLERIFSEYVWRRYLKFLGKPRRYFTQRNKYSFQIQWDHLHFDHTTVLTELDPEHDILKAFESSPSNERRRLRKGAKNTDSYISVSSDVGAPIVVCSANFDNSSDMTRTFKFRAQRDVPLSVSVSYKEFYVLGDTTNIDLSVPDVIAPATKDDRLLIETTSQSETFQDTYNLDVDVDVTVKPGHRTEVMCVVHEQERTADVEVQTVVSLPGGFLPVEIRRLSDGVVVYTCFITSLSEVFKHYTSPNLVLRETIDKDSRSRSTVLLFSRGRCTVTGWKDQQIIVMSEPILDAIV